MIPLLRALVIALSMASASPSLAQPSPASSGTPSVQGPPITDSEKTHSKQDHQAPATKVPVLNTPQANENHQSGGHSAGSSDRVRADEDAHGRNETIIANFTIALAAATVLLMVATGMLWWETRKMAVQAVEASKDTKRSIKIAEGAALETARAAQAAEDSVSLERAWMLQSAIDQGDAVNSHFDGVYYEKAYVCAIKWTNLGRSPALNVNSYVRIVIIAAQDELPIFEPEDVSPGNESFMSIGSGISVSSIFAVVDHSDAVKISNRTHRAILYGRCKYLTIDNQRMTKTTEFCAAIDFMKIELLEGGRYKYHTLTGPVGTQNKIT